MNRTTNENVGQGTRLQIESEENMVYNQERGVMGFCVSDSPLTLVKRLYTFDPISIFLLTLYSGCIGLVPLPGRDPLADSPATLSVWRPRDWSSLPAALPKLDG